MLIWSHIKCNKRNVYVFVVDILLKTGGTEKTWPGIGVNQRVARGLSCWPRLRSALWFAFVPAGPHAIVGGIKRPPSCTWHIDNVVRGIVVQYTNEAGRRSAAPECSFLVSERGYSALSVCLQTLRDDLHLAVSWCARCNDASTFSPTAQFPGTWPCRARKDRVSELCQFIVLRGFWSWTISRYVDPPWKTNIKSTNFDPTQHARTKLNWKMFAWGPPHGFEQLCPGKIFKLEHGSMDKIYFDPPVWAWSTIINFENNDKH